jgi:hypothetical protein
VVLSIPYRMTTARDYKIAAWMTGVLTILAPIIYRKDPMTLVVVVVCGAGFVSSLAAYRKIRKEETK